MFAPQGWLQGRGNRSVYRTIAHSDLFDKTWYRRENLSGLWKLTDPIWHYIKRGWQQRTDPSPRFDTDFYLTWNKDIRESLINPLDHYLSYGAGEGRAPLRPLAQWWPEDLAAVAPIKFYAAISSEQRRISLVLDANTPNRWRGDHVLLVLLAQWLASHLGRDLRVLLRNNTEMPSIDQGLFHQPPHSTPIQVTRIPDGFEYSDIARYEDEIFIASSWSSATSLHNSLGGHKILSIITTNEPRSLPAGDARALAHQALTLSDVSYLVLAGNQVTDLWPKGSKPKKAINAQEINLGSFLPSRQPTKAGGPLVIWAGNNALDSRVRSILTALERMVAAGSLDPVKQPITLVGKSGHRVLLLGTHPVSITTPESLAEELGNLATSSLVIAATGSGEPHPVALCASSIGRNVVTSVADSSTTTDIVALIEQALQTPQREKPHATSTQIKAITGLVHECGKHFPQ